MRDVQASLGNPAIGPTIRVDVLKNNQLYCSLIVPEGAVTSNVVSGINLKPLGEKDALTLNIAVQPQTPGASVILGRDLTVTIRL